MLRLLSVNLAVLGHYKRFQGKYESLHCHEGKVIYYSMQRTARTSLTGSFTKYVEPVRGGTGYGTVKTLIGV